ncbi:cysteine--tRNA ligase [Novacetimonas hansenii]|uniref:cysteine--tRNA ligase n=1 Tax=Novacetimonas hansenii TaxID=436 RepID=UPI00094F9F9E|nr:cysteine--tRNA ligase [Novacetimonas hansenii]PYD71774.1 cysteine--tRNA ligase [Novacetimonas hansenii]
MTQTGDGQKNAHPLRLTNTLSGSKQIFVPRDPNRVTMYVCGPTVYNYAHLGNARSAVVFDLLYRILRHSYGRVLYARNFTDVDDKINAEAVRTGQPIGAITDRFISAYHADMAALGVLRPDFEPRVTEHLSDIIALIDRLLEAGHAYQVAGHVLFHVPSFANYGRLSGRSRNDVIAGARVEVAPFKRDPADFVLWKPSSDDLPGWESPWGRGRPGWHIECSAMTEHCLGLPIDLHGGGQDLIFPHHENEIAQSVSARNGAAYCDFWVHNGFVTVDGRKMSKSLGNVVLAHDLLKRHDGQTIRLALLSAHYRQPLDWSDKLLTGSGRALSRLKRLLADTVAPDDGDAVEAISHNPVVLALEDDLNTPMALSGLFGIARKLRHTDPGEKRSRLRHELVAALSLLGLDLENDGLEIRRHGINATHDAVVADMVAQRDAARRRKDYEEADRLRAALQVQGVALDDTHEETRWVMTRPSSDHP